MRRLKYPSWTRRPKSGEAATLAKEYIENTSPTCTASCSLFSSREGDCFIGMRSLISHIERECKPRTILGLTWRLSASCVQ